MNQTEKIALGSLAVAVCSCVLAALVVPEVRIALGLPLEHAVEQPRNPAPDPVPVETFLPSTTTTSRFHPGTTSAPRESPPAAPVRGLAVHSASASSVLPSSRVAAYGPGMVLDGDGATPWVEGVPGYGIGEWIELELGRTRRVTRIEIFNGYDKGARFRENGRVRTLTAHFSNGETRTLGLSDRAGPQTFGVGDIPASSVRLVIGSIYPGSRWEDTALGDVSVVGY